MRISDWSSDVCSSDLPWSMCAMIEKLRMRSIGAVMRAALAENTGLCKGAKRYANSLPHPASKHFTPAGAVNHRSEEHTSELQSLMRISYAVFCMKKKKQTHILHTTR